MRKWTPAWPVVLVAWVILLGVPQLGGAAGAREPQQLPDLALSDSMPLVGENFRVSGAAATKDDEDPAVAYNPVTDQFLVVWRDGRNSATRGRDIYGQLVAGDGSKVGYNFRISGAAALDGETMPAAAFNPATGGYMVVWADLRKRETRGVDIYGQMISPDGSRDGYNFRVSVDAATGDESQPALAFNSVSDQFLVVWSDSRGPGFSESEVYGRRIKANGQPKGDEFKISNDGFIDEESWPAVAYNPASNQYLVTWQVVHWQATVSSDIYGQRVKGSGRLAGSSFRISGDGVTSRVWDPEVVANPANNEYLVVWEDQRNGVVGDINVTGWNIYGRRVKATGRLAGDDFRISGTPETTEEWSPKAAYNPDTNRYLVVWDDGRNYGNNKSDIYGRAIKATGKLASGEVRISGDVNVAKGDPAVANDPTNHQYLVVWEDARDTGAGSPDIYGQLVAG